MRLNVYVPLVLLAAATPAMADLATTSNLGTAATGVYALNDTTVGKANNAETYTALANTTTVPRGYGEAVYQFTLTKPAYLYLTDTVEPAAGTDHDYFLLNSLTTFASDNSNPYFAGKPEATSLGYVSAAMGSTTAGSSQLSGVFSSAGNTNGVRGPGTYYVAVDGRSGAVTAAGAPSSTLPDGAFNAKFHVTYVDEVVAPLSTATKVQSGAQVRGAYGAGQVKFFSFDYTGGAFTVDTEGNTINESGGDTFLALYDSAGKVVKFNDDIDFRAFSQIIVADGELANGTYYLGFTEYKGEANPGFDLRVYPDNVGASGEFVINGLALLPEPTSLAVAAASLTTFGIRRRRAAR